MLKFIKKWLQIIQRYDADYEAFVTRVREVEQRVVQAETVIRERTDCHADLHYKGTNYVITVGRYKDRDYIKTYAMSDNDFVRVVEHLREIGRYAQIARVDAPPIMRCVVESELQIDSKINKLNSQGT